MAAPLHRQMAEDLRQQIESGRLCSGDLAGPDRPGMSELPQDGRAVVAEIVRTAFDENGIPVRIAVTDLPADRNLFVAATGCTTNPHVQPGGRGHDPAAVSS